MIAVKLNYKKALRQARKEQRQVERRFSSVCRRELKRGGKRYSRDMARQIKKNTGIKLVQKEIMSKYIKTRFKDSTNVNKMEFLVTAKREGIGLIHFIRGKPKQTKGPVKKRKSPYVSVYKGKKVRVKRGFVLKLKKPGKGDPYKFFVRNNRGYHPARTPSIITLLENSGYSLRKTQLAQMRRILIAVYRRRAWFTAPLTSPKA